MERWQDCLQGVQTLADLIQTCQDAFSEDDAAPKVSVTTKKRLTIRAMQGLQGGSALVQALAGNLRELQEVVQQQQQDSQQAQDSNQCLQQQLRSSDDECRSSKRLLLQAEAQKLGLQQQVEQLRQQLQATTDEKGELHGAISDLQGELQHAGQQVSDAHGHLAQLQQQVELLAAATREAEAGADAAAEALQAAREEADKERAARGRHEDAVARLTADNLVFMARLRAAEAGAAAAAAERDELRLALEQHKGPWMDEVHQGVELRVKAALARAEELEAQQELATAQHAQHTQQLHQQQADLEVALQAAQQQAAELRRQLMTAQSAASEARSAAEEAAVLATSAQAAADERAAELRVVQDSLRSMREECNERWMSERAARGQLAEQQEQLSSLEASVAKLKQKLQARSDDLATQRAVNQQLMLKKEEVEWQLLAAIAQLHSHQAGSLPGAASGSPKALSPESFSESNQQQQPQATTEAGAPSSAQLPAAATSAQAAAATAVEAQGCLCLQEQLSSPFGASAQLPLSPVHPSPKGQQLPPLQLPQVVPPPVDLPQVSLASAWQQLGAEGVGRLALPPAGPSAAAAAAAGTVPNRTALYEVPGPAVVAAGGGLWQLPNGSSSGLFGSRVSSSGGGVHPLAALANPMPAATAAAVGALLGSKTGSMGSLHHAFSCPEGDMYSLPRLGFGLATLPSPDQLVAAAEAAVSGSGGLQKTVTIGRAGSLTVPVPLTAVAGGGAAAAGGGSGGGGAWGSVDGSAGGAAAAAVSGGIPSSPRLNMSGSVQRSLLSSSDPGGPPGSLTFPLQSQVQPILLGTTGGLMADFTPLSPGVKGPSSNSRGAVFPECITASAVTDEEQAELHCFSFAAGLTDALQQQQQQQVLCPPGFWYLQQQQQQELPKQQQQQDRQHGSSESLSDGGQHVHHSSSACGSSGSLHDHNTAANKQQQPQPRGRTRTSRDGVDAVRAAAAAEDVGEQQQLDKDSSAASSNAGSNAHLHGILINGLKSRSRSPARGVSPSSSLKSVRFSFEGLDSQGVAAEGDQEPLGDQKGGRRSSSSSMWQSVSPPSGRSGHGRSGSEWLRHTLYEQLASHASHGHSPRGVGGSPHANREHEVHSVRRHHSRAGSSAGGSSSRQWGASSHPPAHAQRGAQYLGRFAERRQGHHSQLDLMRQQQRQVRQQQAEKEVAAMQAAIKERAKGQAPAHPYFGAMHPAAARHPAA